MNCETAKKNAPLFLYGELSLEEEQGFQDHIDCCAECRAEVEAEKKLHQVLDQHETELDPALLARCRNDLGSRIAAEAARPSSIRSWFAWISDLRLAALARPVGAVALVALGFFGARWTAPSNPAVPTKGPVISRVRYLQPEPSGKLRLIVEETRQKEVWGTPDNDQIRRLLMTAARESADPGLRADSMDVLQARHAGGELRPVLIYALRHDPNAGVRLKALDALKPYAAESDVRTALSQVLLADENPGVRAQAIDLLVEQKRDDTIGVLQQAVQKEQNDYVRMRCQRALEDMNASIGTF